MCCWGWFATGGCTCRRFFFDDRYGRWKRPCARVGTAEVSISPCGNGSPFRRGRRRPGRLCGMGLLGLGNDAPRTSEESTIGLMPAGGPPPDPELRATGGCATHGLVEPPKDPKPGTHGKGGGPHAFFCSLFRVTGGLGVSPFPAAGDCLYVCFGCSADGEILVGVFLNVAMGD